MFKAKVERIVGSKKSFNKEVGSPEEGFIYSFQNREFYDDIKILKENDDELLFQFHRGEMVYINEDAVENSSLMKEMVEKDTEQKNYQKQYNPTAEKEENHHFYY